MYLNHFAAADVLRSDLTVADEITIQVVAVECGRFTNTVTDSDGDVWTALRGCVPTVGIWHVGLNTDDEIVTAAQ